MNLDFPVLRSDASPQVLTIVKQFEERCEQWADKLTLVRFTRDVAVWGVLTEIIDLIEQQVKQFGHGSRQQREAMINLGRAGARLLGEMEAMKFVSGDSWLRWTQELRETTQEAILTTHNCEAFVGSFVTWHHNRRAVEILSPTRLRFSIPPHMIERRIQAYQQGRRISGWPSTADNPIDQSFVNDQDVNSLLDKLCDKVTVEGALAIRYPDDSELLSVLRDVQYDKLQRAFRRTRKFDLGGYDLTNFRRCFAVLQSICAVHEYICDYWQKKSGRYPFESAVMNKSSSEWIRLISELGGLNEAQVSPMLSDLTFGTIRPLDIYIQPFVPSRDGKRLFLIPHVIMNSRPEENILRVCSYARPDNYRPIAQTKEEDMRESIKADCPARYTVFGPLKLPDAKLPDIDVIIKDSANSQLLIGELKWLRKPTRVIDHRDKDAELEEGFEQLRAIREFLERRPTYLKERGVTERGETDVKLSFAVIARDHLCYPPQADDLWLTEFDALIWAFSNTDNLTDCISKLQSFEWLPVEGRDFTVRFEPSSLAGETIECEVFHPV
jgi:hypothetical protein